MDDLKARLLKPRLAEAEVDIEGVGTVRVRALNRGEAMSVQAVETLEAKERRIVALGMVSPKLTEAEVGKWQRNAPAGELEPVTQRISELSGLADGAAKKAVEEFQAEPEREFRVLPGPRTVDDGGGAAGGDA